MKRFYLLMACFLLALLWGCELQSGGTKQEKNESEETTKNALGLDTDFIDSGHTEYMSNGVYFTSGGALQYVDPETGESSLVCFDPTCDHKWRRENDEWQTTCFALRVGYLNIGSCVIEDELYVLTDATGRDSLGKVLYKTGFDRYEPQTVATMEDFQWSRGSFCYGQDTLFLSDFRTHDYSRYSEGIISDLDTAQAVIVKVSLRDGTVRQLVQKEKENQQSIIMKMSCDGSFLYYLYQYMDGERENQELWKYDLQTDTEELIHTFLGNQVIFLGSRKVCYQIDGEESNTGRTQLYVMDMNGASELVAETDAEHGFDAWASDEGVLIIRYEEEQISFLYYGFKSKELKTLGETKMDNNIHFEAAFPDYIYFWYGSGIDIHAAVISMEDFTTGNFENIKKLFDYNASKDIYYEE